MKILIVAATSNEIAPTLKHFGYAGENFLETEKFDVLITGVGMVATAFALGQHLSGKYHLVLNVGIAGSFDRNIALGQVLHITEDTFAELGAEDNDSFISLPQLGFGESTFYATAGEISNLKKVKGITVNKVHGSVSSIEHVVKIYHPETESMEGAAVFYACNQLNISVLQIRSISNYVEPRNKANWEIGLAIGNLNAWLAEFIESL